jgi:putative nucleotidyltransferase with HDIG domain
MLKVIPTEQVRLGMHIQELKGAWIDHPFWKTSFKLEDSAVLKKLQTSKVREVVIDTTKGLDVIKVMMSVSEETEVEEPVTAPVPTPKPAHVTAMQEHERAKKVISSSKKAVISMFNDVRMGKAVNAESAMQCVDEIAASVARNEGALISLLRLKNKDDYTYMHSVAVSALMVVLAKELGLSEREVRQAGLAGLLHDIGKAAVPMDYLNKAGALTDEEFAVVRLHPERGYELMKQANITDEVALDVCLHHHEKMNGKGYPHQLQGDEISLFAKMGAVCDVYDAITSSRAYKPSWEPSQSLQRMAQWNDHFDDTIFKAFVKSVGIYPIGSMVKLKSGRLAVVMDQSQKSLLQPIVKVFFSITSQARIPVEVLDLSKPGFQDTVVGYEDPAKWGLHNINALWSQ